MKHRILALFHSLVPLVLAWTLSPAHAVPPGIFYRVVGSPPDVVFPRGFLPRGHNRNLLNHLSGLSCNHQHTEPGSAYVSTTELESRALVVARERIEQQQRRGIQDPNVWMYTIRGTRNFYDAVQTFEASNFDGPEIDRAIQAARDAAEWVVNGPIRPEQIISARQVRMRDGQLYYYGIEPVVVNPRYVQAEATFSPNPLPANVVNGQGNLLRQGIYVAGNFMSGCWCSNGAGASSRQLMAPRTELGPDSEKICEAEVRLFNPADTMR